MGLLVHARALLASTPTGVTDYIDGDLREPDKILERATRTLDFDQPVAVMLLGILKFVPDDEQAYGIVSELMDAVPSGSFLAIAHSTNEIKTEAVNEAARRWNEGGSTSLTLRNRAGLSRFFDGLELLEPGVGSCSLGGRTRTPAAPIARCRSSAVSDASLDRRCLPGPLERHRGHNGIVISLELARKLRAAGVRWEPAPGDKFVLPDRGMDDDVFVLSHMVVDVHEFPSGRVIGFNGTVEWALDSVEQEAALWLPSEEQLRELLGDAFVQLVRSNGSFCVTLDVAGQQVEIVDENPAAAYGTALHYLATGE